MTGAPPAGWHPDPLGRHGQRWWDGRQWTEDVNSAGKAAKDPIQGSVATAAPPLPARRAARKKWPWVLGGIALFCAVAFVGCVALVGTAVNEAVDKLNAEQAAHAITQPAFDAVQVGTPQDAVIQQLGKQPENTQEFVSRGILTDSDLRSSCIYYNRDAGKFGDRYQFCFDNGLLRSKNAYLSS